LDSLTERFWIKLSMQRGFPRAVLLMLSIQCFHQTGLTQNIDFHGQASGWFISHSEQSPVSQLGIRYIPNLFYDQHLFREYRADAELSLNSFGLISMDNWKRTDSQGKIKLYRLWGRFSADQFEIRLGLQKLNFGPAVLLRSLMWFDRIDPRDPLQLTDGVYALLGRYYFLNNANLWLWGLYGNEDLKGLEFFPTAKNTLEFGGRFQMPVRGGEAALTYHHRRGVLKNINITRFIYQNSRFPENRFAFDGKWDVGIGLWFEAALIHRRVPIENLKYQKLWTIGADYTFGIGNGLNTIFEQFTSESADRIFSQGNAIRFSGFSLNYPLGLVDRLFAIIYYDWENDDWYRLLNWNRQYDNWSFYLLAFWNPQTIQLYQSTTGNNPFAGKGIQLLVVFNH
jgi:hypothetical protein